MNIEYIRNKAAKSFSDNIGLLDKLLKYYSLYNKSSNYNYNNYEILNDVISIDITSFNINFIKICNIILKNDDISIYIESFDGKTKKNRVIEFGLFYKILNIYKINLSMYMVSMRNVIFCNFFNIYNISNKSINLKRINYDDIEFITVKENYGIDNFVNEKYLNISKIVRYDKIIVLNKSDGIYYLKDNNIVNVKYTSGWVNIPAYYNIIKYVIDFIIGNIKSIKILNDKIYDYIHYADNSDFFKYESDDISNSFNPEDLVPNNIKYLFVANVMNKFLPLIK